jgi:hypothetical protein
MVVAGLLLTAAIAVASLFVNIAKLPPTSPPVVVTQSPSPDFSMPNPQQFRTAP